MKIIFFLIILFAVSIPSVFAQTVEQAENYDKVKISDGENISIYKFTPQRVLDNTEWKPFVVNQTPTSIQVETATGSFIFDKNQCSLSFYDTSKITQDSIPVIANDYYIPRQALNGTENWNVINQINNAVCQPTIIIDGNNIEIQAIKQDPSLGILKTRYIKNFNSDLKTQIEVTNLSAFTDRKFSLQQMIDVPKIINFGNQQRNLENFNGTVLDRNFLLNNEAKILRLTDKIEYDFDLGFDTLNSITIISNATNASLLMDYSFNATVIQPGQTLILDPTLKFDAGTSGTYVVRTTAVSGASCGTPDTVLNPTTGRYDKPTDAITDFCYITAWEWDITSISDGSIVLDVMLEVEGSSPVNPDWANATQVLLQPSILSAQDLWDEIINGTQYIESQTLGQSTARNNFTLGPAATTDLQNALVNDWFAVGLIEHEQETRDANTQRMQYTGEYNLFVTVVEETDPITDLSCGFDTSPDDYSIDCGWTQPNGTGIIGYQVQRDIGSGFTVYVNNTNTLNTYYNDTSIPEVPWIRYNVLVWGHNATGDTVLTADSNYENVTVNLPQPATLVATNIGYTALDLDWTQPDLFGATLSGYQINYTTPHSNNPATVLVNNTNSTTTSYTVSDLAIGTQYSFRVYPWLDVTSYYSNIVNTTTLGEPFVIGDLDISESNPNRLDIIFERTDVNTTHTQVDVIYSNPYNITCTVSSTFGLTSQNYSNLDEFSYSSTQTYSRFFFVNQTNDIVNLHCFNENDVTQDANYQLTWSQFPLLDQLANFRDGTYGTQGMFGVIDFITLAVIIFSMIGMNRVNETVGVFFNVALIGALAFFEIIQINTVIFGAIAVALIFAITTTRKT